MSGTFLLIYICNFHVSSNLLIIYICEIRSAKTDCGDVPVHSVICNTLSQRGLIATIDETGLIKLSYLGTSPLAAAVSSFSRDLNYDKIDEEHKRLLQIIRDSQMTSNDEAKEKLVMRAQVNFFWFTYVISMFYIIFFLFTYVNSTGTSLSMDMIGRLDSPMRMISQLTSFPASNHLKREV
jgi:PTHB1 N-terminus